MAQGITKSRLGLRRDTYFRVNSDVTSIKDGDVAALLERGDVTRGWGKHQTVDIGGTKVFVKRVPVTDVELANPFSTRNLYDLPLYYNYGVGSAGFGAFRELQAHTMTTGWVLEGKTGAFPLLYQFRIIPSSGERTVLDTQRRNTYVAYWGGSESVGRYLDDRLSANQELVLFLEHVPHTLHHWLLQHPSAAEDSILALRDAISFLRRQGVVHFDPHFFNVLTDGEQTYLTDFGLASSRSFDLSAGEQRFLSDHEYYDYGEVLWSIGRVLVDMYQQLSDQRKRAAMESCGITGEIAPHALQDELVRNFEQIAAAMGLDQRFIAVVLKYREVILLMDEFFTAMHTSNEKSARPDLARLRRLLEDSGFLE
jgi:hypothetical protein